MSVNLTSYEKKNWDKMFFVILRDLPFFWPFCEAYTRMLILIKLILFKFSSLNY